MILLYRYCALQIIGRTDTDPDFVPRTRDFGLNVAAFHAKYGSECPSPFFNVAVSCCKIAPDERLVYLCFDRFIPTVKLKFLCKTFFSCLVVSKCLVM